MLETSIDHGDYGFSKLTRPQRVILSEILEFGNCGLALPMGSGKTILSLVAALKKSPKKPILIIVPKSLISGWRREIHKFFDGTRLVYQILHNDFGSVKKFKIAENTRIVITTPHMALSAYKSQKIADKYITREIGDYAHYNLLETPPSRSRSGPGLLYSNKWGALIVDEVHLYTNIETGCCRAISSIVSKFRLLLSGTILDEPRPIRIMGYYQMLGRWGIKNQRPPLTIQAAKQLVMSRNYGGLKATFVSRSTNESYTPPTVNSQIIYHELSELEAAYYGSFKKLIGNMHDAILEMHAGSARSRLQAQMMAVITNLRQTLVSTRVAYDSFIKNDDHRGTRREFMDTELGQKPKDPETLKENMLMCTIGVDHPDSKLHGLMPDILSNHVFTKVGEHKPITANYVIPEKSTRIEKTIELIDTHKDEQILIFSCFRSCIDKLREFIDVERPVFTIESSMSTHQRLAVEDAFRESKNGVMLLTYAIGANGLNLQTANNIVLLDYWWNVGKTRQAVARILRQGQMADIVNIYYMSSSTGLEKQLYQKHTEKLLLSEAIYEGNTQFAAFNLENGPDINSYSSSDSKHHNNTETETKKQPFSFELSSMRISEIVDSIMENDVVPITTEA